MEEYLLSGDEVARILHVSRSYAYLMMKRGDIPTVRMGASVRVHPQDLEQFIQQKRELREKAIGPFTRSNS